MSTANDNIQASLIVINAKAEGINISLKNLVEALERACEQKILTPEACNLINPFIKEIGGSTNWTASNDVIYLDTIQGQIAEVITPNVAELEAHYTP